MQIKKTVEGITKILDFYFSSSQMKVLGKNGLCTLLNNEDLSFAYPDKWFKDWYGFDEDYYLVEREDGLKTLIWKKDGSFVNENFWFKHWFNNFDFKDSEIILVEREDGLSTILRKKDLSFICKDKWAISWNYFNEDTILMKKDDKGLSTLVNISNGSYVYDNLWFYTWKIFDENKYLVSTNNHKTLINRSDGSLVYENFYAKEIYNFNDKYLVYEDNKYGVFVDKDTLNVIDTKIMITRIKRSYNGVTKFYLDNTDNFMIGVYHYKNGFYYYTLLTNDIYTDYLNWTDFCMYTKDKTELRTVISTNHQRKPKVIIDDIMYFESTSTDNIYLVTREDGKQSMFNIKTCTYLYKDAWFYGWDYVNKDLYQVKREDGLSTLIYKSDGTYVFKDLWFKIWFDVNKKYFQVYTTDNKTTFIKKSDGSLLFDLVPKENLRKPSFYSPNVFICKDGNLTEFIL